MMQILLPGHVPREPARVQRHDRARRGQGRLRGQHCKLGRQERPGHELPVRGDEGRRHGLHEVVCQGTRQVRWCRSL